MAFFKKNEPVPELTGEARKQMLLDRVEESFKDKGWKYEVVDEKIKSGTKLDSKLGSCKINVRTDETGISVDAVCPINATAETYANVVEFITRANYGLKAGGFQFDYRDGEVKYHNFLSSRMGTPSLEDIFATVIVSVLMLDHYGDGLAKNIMGFGDPEKDIAAIED